MFKNILKKIPPNRIILYLMMAGLLPLFLVTFDFMAKRKELKSKASFVSNVCHKALVYKRKEAQNERVYRYFLESDPHYIKNQLESITFLQNEQQALEKMISNHSFPGSESIHTRYEFLTSGANKLFFVEDSSESSDRMYETHLSLTHPIELDTEDLKLLLERLERGGDLGSPQLIMTDFTLLKKTRPNGCEVFEINKLKLLKREFKKDD